jgi:hypothetical protein
MFRRSLYIVSVIIISTSLALANLPAGYEDPEHGEAHTHIGINFDGISGTADDNRLWIGSVQTGEDGSPNADWPNWPVLELLPQFDDFGNPILNEQGKQFYKADEPDGWFSAHPENGAWQLGGTDESIIPGWNISIKRIAASDGFFMLRQNDGQIILANNGDTEDMHKEWEQWLENGSGEYGAWGCHHHISFCAWADGPGQLITATLTAIDTGVTGFAESEPFTIQFVTVPEPTSMILLSAGLLSLLRRK